MASTVIATKQGRSGTARLKFDIQKTAVSIKFVFVVQLYIHTNQQTVDMLNMIAAPPPPITCHTVYNNQI